VAAASACRRRGLLVVRKLRKRCALSTEDNQNPRVYSGSINSIVRTAEDDSQRNPLVRGEVDDRVAELVSALKLCALFGIASETSVTAIRRGEQYLARANRLTSLKKRSVGASEADKKLWRDHFRPVATAVRDALAKRESAL
jgi:hypothetical protein